MCLSNLFCKPGSSGEWLHFQGIADEMEEEYDNFWQRSSSRLTHPLEGNFHEGDKERQGASNDFESVNELTLTGQEGIENIGI
jgi:hypothetical protein